MLNKQFKLEFVIDLVMKLKQKSNFIGREMWLWEISQEHSNSLAKIKINLLKPIISKCI